MKRLQQSKEQFKEKYPGAKLEPVECIGGSSNSPFIKNIVAEVFGETTSYLNKRESQIDGAAHYLLNPDRIQYQDETKLYGYKINDKKELIQIYV